MSRISDAPDSDEHDREPAQPRIRLQRFLAACGLGSRRACEQYISDGRVTIDGQTVEGLGATVNPSIQKIALDGERLRMERKKYYVLNKPPGFLCTNADPSGRRRAIDLFPKGGPRLFTVGRLDENSTGVLVVTNDGDLAEKMAHPRSQIFRTYHLQVAGHPTREIYESLKEGLHFSDGRFRVLSIKSLKKVGQSTWLEVVLSQGHNRELRRLFARVGHKVLKLTRIAFGPVRLGRLKLGEFRDLTLPELESLHSLAEKAGKPERSKKPGAARKPGGSKPHGANRSGGGKPDGGKPHSSGKPGGSRPAGSRPGGKRPGSSRPPGNRSRNPRR
jgi:23S rRNA pseudouridine2605 synthase